jgi:MFS family permease
VAGGKKAEGQDPGGTMSLRIGTNTFRAFRNRNYRLFYIGQSISRIGMWMQRTAVLWVVYSMTHSPFMLGVTMFAEQFPSFLFSLLGGVISDRYDRYKLILLTQTASMLQAILLTVLVFSGNYAVWQILALSFMLGMINALDVPTRQPLVHAMVNDPADLPNAIAFNSSLANLAKMIGPAVSGFVLKLWGADICFLLNAVSFIAVITCLLMMKLPPRVRPFGKKKVRTELADAFRYLLRTPEIAHVIGMLALMSLLVLPYQTLLPIFAKVVFLGDAATYGAISGFIGLGALLGAVFLASLRRTDLKRVLLINTVLLGMALIAFSFLRSFPAAMAVALVIGFGAMAQTTVCITIVQVRSDAAFLGRVMSYVAMAALGMMPLGSLLVGAVSERIGADHAMLGQGMLALIIAAVFFRSLMRRRAGMVGTV